MKHRMLQDNVLLRLEEREAASPGGILHPGFAYKSSAGNSTAKKDRDPRIKSTGVRWARVLAAGPGYHPGCKKCGCERKTFIRTTLRPGDRVLVSELSGYDYALDMKGIRQRDRTELFDFIDDEELGPGEYRIIREDEALWIEVDDTCPDTVKDADPHAATMATPDTALPPPGLGYYAAVVRR